MSNGLFDFSDNQILNPTFTDDPETAEPDPLHKWNHSGDVTVTDWPTPLPSEFAEFFDFDVGQCVALGAGGELGQLLGFMPTQHDLYFVFQTDDATPVDLTVTVKYTDRELNIRETSHTLTESDFDRRLDAFKRFEIPLERDTSICYFNVVNNAPEGEGIAPVYVGLFYLEVTYPEYVNIVNPRFWWWVVTLTQYLAENPPPAESPMSRPPQSMKAMSPGGRMLAAQIFALDRKLARLTKRLGLQEEEPSKPEPGKKKPKTAPTKKK